MKANEKVAQFVDVLDRISQNGFNVPGLIMSSPGYGKTSTVEMYCKRRGYNLTTLIASQYAPDDILGLQAMKDGRLERMTPSWFNDLLERSKNGRRNILFIDEITTCDEFIQAPLMNLIFTRRLNSSVALPENTTLIAAGNYSEELNNQFKLSLPIVNRFLILNLRQDDYDFDEIFRGRFANVKSDEEIDEFLNLSTGETNYWSYGKIANYMKSELCSNRVIKIKNSSASGLLGFRSVRSVDYSLKFLSIFCKYYMSNLWEEVIGDTLGELGDIPIRSILSNTAFKFLNNGESGDQGYMSIEDLINLYIKGDSYVVLKSLREMVLSHPEDVTDSEISLMQKHSDAHHELGVLLSQYTRKMTS